MSQFEEWKKEEEEIQKLWDSRKIYEKVKELRKGSKIFYFLDGPPYATGYIHIGTAMNKILKDCYIRFFRMHGFDVWDQPGYDTHGVPIENKVEKKLGFKTKKDIERFGVEKFIRECKSFAGGFIPIMNKQFMNLGVWMDWSNPYITYSNEYIEGAWYTFKKAFEGGFLFKGTYPVHVCPHCETVVAYNEIEHKKVTDTSIFVKFGLKGKSNEYLLIWTTTPWTLPANTGVMVKPSADYVKVKVGSNTLILAKQLFEIVMKKAGITDYKIISTVKGEELKGTVYEHPMADIFKFQSGLKDAHRVVLSEQYVTLEDGTGLVHTAPGHGQEDFKVGQQSGLPAVSPVKMDGTYDDSCGKYTGIFVKDADKMIIQELDERGALFHKENIDHEYPMCWRCSTPLLLISVPQWFFKVSAIRERLIEENKSINWVPDWAGHRFHNWLESLSDWPISRQRYWGIPLPIWTCQKCNNVKVVGSRTELPKVPADFHRPFIDAIILKCDKCDGEMKRIPDVLDVWFDSGVAPWASLGYPKNQEIFKKMWPVNFILEGPDQIRGWWNSLMITSLMTFGRRPFDNVMFHGFVLDAHGVKMSKSKGNIVEPEEMVGKYGRDILRFYFLSGVPWDDYYFKWEDVTEVAKSFIVLRNTFNFVKMYVKDTGSDKTLQPEDRWMLSKLNSLVENCTEYCESFQAHKAAKELLDFILNDFSRWYVKLVRDRVWPLYTGNDKEAAFYTLYTVTETLLRLMAPLLPFLSEEFYQDIVKPMGGDAESIHLTDWPRADKKSIDKKLETEMDVVKAAVDAAGAARQKAGIKLRWPVRDIIIISEKPEAAMAVGSLNKVLTTICNCKNVDVAKQAPIGDYAEADFSYGKVLVNTKLDAELLEEAMTKEIVREIQELRKKNKFDVSESVKLTMKSDSDTNEILNNYIKYFSSEVGAQDVTIGEIEGTFKSELKFRDKTISIGFDRI